MIPRGQSCFNLLVLYPNNDSSSCSNITIYFAVMKVTKSQKQPPEVFCKKSCSQKFRNIHGKTAVLESLFIK